MVAGRNNGDVGISEQKWKPLQNGIEYHEQATNDDDHQRKLVNIFSLYWGVH